MFGFKKIFLVVENVNFLYINIGKEFGIFFENLFGCDRVYMFVLLKKCYVKEFCYEEMFGGFENYDRIDVVVRKVKFVRNIMIGKI